MRKWNNSAISSKSQKYSRANTQGVEIWLSVPLFTAFLKFLWHEGGVQQLPHPTSANPNSTDIIDVLVKPVRKYIFSENDHGSRSTPYKTQYVSSVYFQGKSRDLNPDSDRRPCDSDRGPRRGRAFGMTLACRSASARSWSVPGPSLLRPRALPATTT